MNFLRSCLPPSRASLAHRAMLFAATAGLLFITTACTKVELKMGVKVDLSQLPVNAMQLTLPNGPGIAPGDKSALVAEFTQPDGKTLVTEGKGGGKVMWRDLSVTATVAKVSNKGVLTLDKDPRTSDGKTVHVEVGVPEPIRSGTRHWISLCATTASTRRTSTVPVGRMAAMASAAWMAPWEVPAAWIPITPLPAATVEMAQRWRRRQWRQWRRRSSRGRKGAPAGGQ